MINSQFSAVSDVKLAYSSEQICIDHLEQLRWDGFVVSPFDASSKVYHCPNNSYKCKNTGKYFNVKTGTIFHDTKVELQKWFMAIWLVENTTDLTSVKLGKELDITQKTAWYILKRIKLNLAPKTTIFNQNISSSIRNIKEVTEKDQRQRLVDWLALYQFKK